MQSGRGQAPVLLRICESAPTRTKGLSEHRGRIILITGSVGFRSVIYIYIKGLLIFPRVILHLFVSFVIDL